LGHIISSSTTIISHRVALAIGTLYISRGTCSFNVIDIPCNWLQKYVSCHPDVCANVYM